MKSAILMHLNKVRRDMHEMLYVFPLLGVTWCRHTPGADMSAVPAIIR